MPLLPLLFVCLSAFLFRVHCRDLFFFPPLALKHFPFASEWQHNHHYHNEHLNHYHLAVGPVFLTHSTTLQFVFISFVSPASPHLTHSPIIIQLSVRKPLWQWEKSRGSGYDFGDQVGQRKCFMTFGGNTWLIARWIVKFLECRRSKW